MFTVICINKTHMKWCYLDLLEERGKKCFCSFARFRKTKNKNEDFITNFIRENSDGIPFPDLVRSWWNLAECRGIVQNQYFFRFFFISPTSLSLIFSFSSTCMLAHCTLKHTHAKFLNFLCCYLIFVSANKNMSYSGIEIWYTIHRWFMNPCSQS